MSKIKPVTKGDAVATISEMKLCPSCNALIGEAHSEDCPRLCRHGEEVFNGRPLPHDSKAPPPTAGDPIEQQTFEPPSPLETALRVVQERRAVYGPPDAYFRRHAILMDLWMGGRTEFLPRDAAMFMLLGKIARLMETPDHEDSITDVAGYLDCYAAVVRKAVA